MEIAFGINAEGKPLEEIAAPLTKARALAGLKGYVTNLAACPDGTPVTPEFVIGSYHQLFQVEMSKPQCCHTCGLSAFSLAPSSALLMLAS